MTVHRFLPRDVLEVDMKLTVLDPVLFARAAAVLTLVSTAGCSVSNETFEAETAPLAQTGAKHARVQVDSCDGDKARQSAPTIESSTVPTDKLSIMVQAVRSSDQPDVIIEGAFWPAAMLYQKPIDANHGPVQLRTSPEDVIKVSVNEHSVICLQDQECKLPYVEGGTYKVSLTRANGEVFDSESPMPTETTVIRPQQNQYYAKSDAIDVAWTPTSSLQTHGITLSYYLNGLCESTGALNWHDEFAATIPSGFLGDCPESLYKMRFTAFYKNGFHFRRIAGVFRTFSVAVLNYSYLDLSRHNSGNVVDRPMTRCELNQILKASESGAAITELSVH